MACLDGGARGIAGNVVLSAEGDTEQEAMQKLVRLIPATFGEPAGSRDSSG